MTHSHASDAARVTLRGAMTRSQIERGLARMAHALDSGPDVKAM